MGKGEKISKVFVPIIGYLDDGVQRFLYAIIDDRVHAHRHGILGENFLGRHVERNRPQIDAHAVVHAWHHEKRAYGVVIEIKYKKREKKKRERIEKIKNKEER